MYVANGHEGGFTDNPLLQKVQDYAAQEGAPVVAVSAAVEAEIAQLDDEDKQIFLEDMGMDEPGLNRVIRAAYELLGLQIGRASCRERGKGSELSGRVKTDVREE